MSTAREDNTMNLQRAAEAALDPDGPVRSQSKTIRARLEGGSPPIHNFDGDQQSIWRLTASATGGDSIKGQDSVGEVIDLKYFYCHTIEMADMKTGEVLPVIRTALIDQSGQCYTFVSGSVVDAIDNVVNIFGYGPYAGEVKFTVKQASTRSGGRIYNLVPA